MKIREMTWEDDNNVFFVFDNGHNLNIKVEDINHLKTMLDRKDAQFIHLGKNISINLDNLTYIIYRSESK